MLKEVHFPAHRRFKSRTDWEPIGFFSDCLCNSTQFDLMLGFFSSSAINVLSYGFASFLYNGGRMRLIVNDILTEQDKEAIANGELDSPLPYFDITDIELLKNTLSERDTHFFDCLAWLIRNNRLEIRIVAPKEGIGISHTKTGVFSDGFNKVGFDGSCNFSRSALIDNLESLTVSCDWDGSTPTATIHSLMDDFELVFTGKDESVVFVPADKVRTRIEGTFKNKELNELLEEEYKFIQQDISNKDLPQTVINALGKAKNKVEIEIERLKAKTESVILQSHEPSFPYESGPRDYQKQAFENWKNNGQKGLFAMATGTGKTITALNCLLEIYKRNGYYKAIILVPTITLVEQWETECRKFHFDNIVKVYSRNKEWQSQVERISANEKYQSSSIALEQNYIIISTYASFSRDNVFTAVNSFKKTQVLLIADESHNMGAPRIIKSLATINYLRRIGLSATPERQYDDCTNNKLFMFFGAKNGFTYEYSMEEAIKNGVLSRYYYYPHLIRLTEEEMDQYIELSHKIAKYFNFANSTFDKEDEVLRMLLLARKRIIHKAANKLEAFKSIIQKRFMEKGNLKYSLIYVPEGNKPDYLSNSDYFDQREEVDVDSESDHLIDLYTEIVSKINQFITVRKFVAGQKDRDQILNDFAQGKIQVLTSMKCLDEGIDVPQSEFAVFCASTGNPRQFIQRRGRVLRRHKDKHMAEIHDLVVAPEVGFSSDSYKMERSLLKNELLRVKNFSLLSENPSITQMELLPVMNHYGLNLYNNNHLL